MAINYAKEYEKFRKQQEKIRKTYRLSGMSEEQIAAMYDFDLACFKRDCAYMRHTTSLEQPCTADCDEEEGMNPLLKKHADALSVYMQPVFTGEFGWLDEIDDAKLARRLSKLSRDELEVITLYAMMDRTQSEIARAKGVSQASINKKLKSIRKKIF